MISNKLFSSEKMAEIRKKAIMAITGLGAAAIMFTSLSLSGLAATKGTVMATAAKVRSNASTSGDSVVSLPQGTVVDIQEEVTGNDGKVWYKIVTDGGQTGYIRSDLMTKTEVEDTTAPSGGQNSGTTLAPGVTAVNPVTAKVSGAQVRVRSSASTSGDIVTTVEKDVALNVLGTATDSTGKIWYQVSFAGNAGTVEGFVRNDFVTLEGELTAPVDTPIVEDPPIDMPGDDVDLEPAPIEETVTAPAKEYETEYKDGEWWLNIPHKNEQYKIKVLFDAAKTNADLYSKSQDTVRKMKYIMGGLILLAAAAVIFAVMVILRFKDLKDALEFGQTEREAMEKRRAEKAKMKANKEKADKKAEASRPAQQSTGQKPAQQGQRPQGQRPQGQRPAQQGQRPQGQRPAQDQRPQSQRPVQLSSQGARPVQKRPATTDVSGNPVNQSKPAANVQARPAQRPQGQQPQGQDSQQKDRVLHNEDLRTPDAMQPPKKPAQRPQGQQPAGQPQQRPVAQPAKTQPQQNKPKNFLEEDDEFEFEFLNWDGDNK